jgi:hypothetical protein
MRIKFNTRFTLPCVYTLKQGGFRPAGENVRVQGYNLEIVPSGPERGNVKVAVGQVFSAHLIPNPLGHDAPWLGLDDTPEGVVIGSTMGAISDWGDLIVVSTDSGEVVSH